MPDHPTGDEPMSLQPHPPRAYYAGAEPRWVSAWAKPTRPARRHRAPFYAALLAAILTVLALVGFILSLAASDTPSPARAPAATELPRRTEPLGQPTSPATQEPAATDPYDVWQATKPADAPDLTRDEAQGRAMLGCGITWAPGTTDAALQAAYAATMCRGG